MKLEQKKGMGFAKDTKKEGEEKAGREEIKEKETGDREGEEEENYGQKEAA